MRAETLYDGPERRRGGGSAGVRALAYFCFFLLFAMMCFGPHATTLRDGGMASLIRQVSYVALLFLTILSAKPWENVGRLACIPRPLVAILLVCTVSLIWSEVPGEGLRRLILTGCIVWIIAILVRQLGYDRSLAAVRYSFAILLAANYIAVIAFPTFGIHQFGDRIDIALVGDWCGIMMHKNFAGAFMAFTICFFLFDAQQMNRLFRIAVIVAAAVFLVFSQSKTSVGMLAGSIVIGYMFGKTSFSWRLALIPTIAIGSVLLMIYLNIYRYAFVQLVNDPSTFTGRIVIWRHLVSYIADNPWLGSGYGSFWIVSENGPIYRYSADWVRTLASGHNGYLDLAATLGVPLAFVSVGLLVVWPFVRILVSGRTTGGRGALLLSLLVFCAGHNMTESSFMERDVLTNVILVLTIVLLWDVSSHRIVSRAGGSPPPLLTTERRAPRVTEAESEAEPAEAQPQPS